MSKNIQSNLVELRKIMIQHREADKIIQGNWWDGETGCFYGCATHKEDDYRAKVQDLEFDVAFYRCCALSGEIPDDDQRPSKLREGEDGKTKKGMK